MKKFFLDKTIPLDKKIKYTILAIIFLPVAIMVLGALANAMAQSRENKKYKKVIKKGLLWDTEYLIERD